MPIHLCKKLNYLYLYIKRWVKDKSRDNEKVYDKYIAFNTIHKIPSVFCILHQVYILYTVLTMIWLFKGFTQVASMQTALSVHCVVLGGVLNLVMILCVMQRNKT